MEAKLVVGILIPAMTAISAAGFLFLWMLNKQLKYGLVLAAGFLLAGFGSGVNVFLEPHWPSFGNFVCGAFYMFAIAALSWGLLARYKMALPIKMTLLILLITNTANGFALGFLPDVTVSFGIITLTAGALCLQMAYQLWGIEQLNPLDKILPPALLAVGILLVADPLMNSLFASEGLPIAGYASSTRWIVMQMMIIVMATVLAASLAMLMVADILQDIQERANIDSLTGISRRGPFENRARTLLQKFENTPLPFTLVVCDIDNFKSINDTHGHLAGDEVIKQVATVLKDSVRESDIVARLGGEEFGVLLWNCNANAARMMAEQMRQNIADMKMPFDVPHITCTASFGVAEHAQGEQYKSLFGRADRALYKAKDSGRNRVNTADEQRLAA